MTRTAAIRRTLRAQRHLPLALGVVVSALLGLGSASCDLDPVQSASEKLLAEDDPLFAPSPWHRAGQPCTVCHSDRGEASPKMALAGTVYWDPAGQIPAAGIHVRVADAATTDRKRGRCFVTNCNGNFYVLPDEFPGLTYPLLVSIQAPELGPAGLVNMNSHIGREPSCAGCHRTYRDIDTPGPISIYRTDAEVKAKNPKLAACPPPPDVEEPRFCPGEGL